MLSTTDTRSVISFRLRTQMPHEDFSVVYSGTIVEADLLKCVLEGAGIHAVLENEFIGTIAPYLFPGGAGAVKVLILRSDMDQARRIVEDFSRKAKGKGKPNLRLVN
jgi:Putative prokaryotic signal transducing protein